MPYITVLTIPKLRYMALELDVLQLYIEKTFLHNTDTTNAAGLFKYV